MGLLDFVKDAGARLFGGDDEPEQAAAPVRTMDDARADKAKGEQLSQLVNGMDFGVEGLAVKFRDGRVTLDGTARSQADREKIVLLVGNTVGVAQVDDRMNVEVPEPEARMHTVVSGDSLSRIAKAYYGDARKYPMIFEANQPMLKDPNKIYPGQVLRIPPLD